MLNRIEIQRKDGGVLTLPIYDATNYQIKDIQGLDPVKANIVTSNFAHIDGTQFQSSRREMRNLVIKLSIDSLGVLTTQELRKELYSYLMPKTDITIKFFRDNLDAVIISGQVESFDSPLFVKEPEATISILCFDPDFKSDSELTFTGSTTIASTNTNLIYDGEVDAGFILTFSPLVTPSSFSLQNTLSDGTVRKFIFDETASPIAIGDTLTISTIPGDKYVRLTHLGVVSSVLWAMDPASDWITLQTGINKIRVTSYPGGQNYTIKYNTRFGGL